MKTFPPEVLGFFSLLLTDLNHHQKCASVFANSLPGHEKEKEKERFTLFFFFFSSVCEKSNRRSQLLWLGNGS